MEIQINFISYKGVRPAENHPHAQLVLALQGGLEIEINGQAGCLDVEHGAFVAPGLVHTQLAKLGNRFLVLNCGEKAIEAPVREQLADSTFLPISPSVRQLISFMETAEQENFPLNAFADQLLQLLTSSLVSHPMIRPKPRLAHLAALVEKSLDCSWTVQEMAFKTGLSPSRLHAVFQEQWNTTPGQWLADLRLAKARQWLAVTDIPIAEMAQMLGYSDQSAFTRAMGRAAGIAPAAYRRQQQEIQSKKQE